VSRVLRSLRRRNPLGAPRRPPARFRPHYDPEAFGRFSEAIARFIGSARFLVFQTVSVIVWVLVNAFLYPWDDNPRLFLLNLAFSTQAAYAAPLILLAQSRQAERERQQADLDRRTNMRALADTEYLARELASIRLALGEMPTRDYLSEELGRVEEELTRLRARLGEPAQAED